MLFTNLLLKEVNCWKKHWYERVVNAFFFLNFYSARPTEIEQEGESPTENVTNSGPTRFIRSR